ncbi:neprilysin-1 isoform X2 [Dermatophagoides farinae]|uniref:neprilysin-1 isoform X2 n=1 Tax=Dermatophagoides farinae TaxID=6954 RepID=UPI003F5F1FF0
MKIEKLKIIWNRFVRFLNNIHESKLEKTLSISSIVLFMALLINNICIYFYYDDATDMFCMSETCDNYSKSLLQSLDYSVDPCDNFYRFACGTMIENMNATKDDYYGTTFLTKMDDIVRDRVQYLLMNSWDVSKNKINRKIIKSKSLAIEWIIRVFQQCLHMPKPKNFYKSFHELWNKLPISSKLLWPLESNSSDHMIDMNWLDFYAYYSDHFGYEPLFKIRFFLQTKLQIKIDFHSSLHQTVQQHYTKQMTNYLYELSRNYNISRMSKENYKKIVDNVIDFEKKITNIVSNTPPIIVNYSLPSFERFTEIKLSNYFHILFTIINKPKINQSSWKSENSTNFITNNDFLVIHKLEAFVYVMDVIRKTPKHVVFNYFWLKALSYWWTENQPNKPENCFQIFYSNEFPLTFAITRLYIDRWFKPGSKLKAIHMVNQLKQSAIQSMEMNTFLDDETREQAVQKLRNIIDNIAFPEWLIIDDHLDEFYGVQGSSIDSLIANHYCQSYVQMLRLDKYRMLKFLNNDEFDFPEIHTLSLQVNAFYSPVKNKIEIKATLLMLPLFDVELPFYINYGKLGSIIGHEITHGFDEKNMKYDKNGNLKHWWAEKSFQNFKERSQCFVEQYQNYSRQSYGIQINTSSLNEDIADNGGVRFAYKAYRTELKRIENLERRPQLLPRLVAKKITIEQLFFLSLAQVLLV